MRYFSGHKVYNNYNQYYRYYHNYKMDKITAVRDCLQMWKGTNPASEIYIEK